MQESHTACARVILVLWCFRKGVQGFVPTALFCETLKQFMPTLLLFHGQIQTVILNTTLCKSDLLGFTTDLVVCLASGLKGHNCLLFPILWKLLQLKRGLLFSWTWWHREQRNHKNKHRVGSLEKSTRGLEKNSVQINFTYSTHTARLLRLSLWRTNGWILYCVTTRLLSWVFSLLW